MGKRQKRLSNRSLAAEKVFFKQADITVKDNLKGKWFPLGTAWLKEKDNIHINAGWKIKLCIFRV